MTVVVLVEVQEIFVSCLVFFHHGVENFRIFLKIASWRKVIATTLFVVTPADIIGKFNLPFTVNIACKTGFAATLGTQLFTPGMVFLQMKSILFHIRF